MRGQVAFETLVTVAAFLAFSLPIVLLLMSLSGLKLEDLSHFHAKGTVQHFSDTINAVYLEGENATRSIILNIPSNARNLTVLNNTVTLKLITSNGQYEVSQPLFANVSDFSNSNKGLIRITIKMENGIIKIVNT